ncbi:MAG TPA: hypothetical protein VJ066_01370 [Candidatus Bathyarchaeia archaeon]|nr:hypothetical protein [Candidatus Bathyarchaeia archaeon]
MVIGEKLWEGKCKTMGMVIKAVGPEGVTIEATWMAQLKGFGKAKGLDGAMMYSGKILMEPSGAGWSHGQGMLNFMTGDMAVVKGSGLGKVEAGKSKSVGMFTFMTMSPKLGWLNSVWTIATQEGDPQWTEFEMVISEWK